MKVRPGTKIKELAADHRTQVNSLLLEIHRLDYYHGTQHLWDAANARFGEGTVAAKEWMNAQ